MNIFTEMTKCFSFPAYRVFRSDSGGKNFLYLLVLSLIGFVLTVGVGIYIPYRTMGGMEGLAEELPEFNMSSDGILTVDDQVNTTTEDNDLLIIDTASDYVFDEDSNVLYKVSADQYQFEVAEDLNNYSRAVVVGKEFLVYCDNSEGKSEALDYTEIPQEYLSKINKPSLVDLGKKLMALFIIAALIFCFIRLAIWNVVNAAIGAIISSSMGVKNTFGQNYAMGLRAYTPMYLICSVLAAFHISFPFKLIIKLLVTGFILSRGIKSIKKQLEDEERKQNQFGMDSDLAFRAMYDNYLTQNDGNTADYGNGDNNIQ